MFLLKKNGNAWERVYMVLIYQYFTGKKWERVMGTRYGNVCFKAVELSIKYNKTFTIKYVTKQTKTK